MRNDPQNNGPDELWVDLVEGEIEPSLREDLALLLLNSPAKRARLDEIRSLRAKVKASDEALMPEDGRFYQDMHDRIMAAVDGAPAVRRARPASAAKYKYNGRSLPRVSPRQLGFPALFGTPTLIAFIAGVTWMTSDRAPENTRHQLAASPTPKPKTARAETNVPLEGRNTKTSMDVD